MPENKRQQDGTGTTRGNAHDRFFNSLFPSPDKAGSIFSLAFNEQQLAHFDLDTIAIEPGNWVDVEELRGQRADLVVSVRLKSGETLSVFILVEHKSRPDSGLMVQILKYQSSLYVQRGANAVLPVVVYHGERPHWPVERTFLESRRLPAGFAEDFSALLLSFGVSLVDLRDPSNRERFDGLDPEVGLGFEFMAHIWEATAQTFARLLEKSLVLLPDHVRVSFLRRAALYLQMVKPTITIEDMNTEVQKRIPGDKAMESIAQEWSWLTREQIMDLCRQEGMEKGRQKEQLEIAERLINRGMSDADISEVTSLTLSEISRLKNGSSSQR